MENHPSTDAFYHQKGREYMESIWSKTIQIQEKDTLLKDNHTEIAVIGGGITGLLTAYFLQQNGKKVVVLEADRIGSGQTKNTTAKITSQHGRIYSTLLKDFGAENARLYAMAHQNAIDQYEKIIEKEHISCHFERVKSYLYSREQENPIRREAEVASILGIRAYFTKKVNLPFPVKGAVCFEKQAQFHPLEFIKALADNLTIYEHTRVKKVKGNCLITNQGRIYAKNIVFATHYPFPNFPGFYFARQHQERSYVIAISGIPKGKDLYYSEDKEGLSFRWYEDNLLIGGGGHRTGEITSKDGYSWLEKKIRSLYPEYTEVARWSAEDCITHDNLPFIGKYSVFHPNWYVATGLKKWGMTGAMVSASLLSDKICGRSNPYEQIFSPARCHLLISRKKLWSDIKHSAKGLCFGHFYLPFYSTNHLKVGEAKIVRIGLQRYGVYKDFSGKLHKTSVKCPHLGCMLHWNPEELSWDCPCHGSRFDYDGKLLDNPAQTNTNV